MKRFFLKTGLSAIALLTTVATMAGNKDRSGQAGAAELLINPWAASSGTFGANTALVKGLEAMKGNIAGLSYTDGTELGLSYNIYLKGTNVNLYNLSFGQKLGDAGVLGVSLTSMNFGEITVTDYNNPTGGIGTYKPSLFNVQLGFAKDFSHAIHAGFGVTYVSEQITNARASGAAFEAGVQYTTGIDDNFHFGVTLRNVGTNMRFTGEGFSFDSEVLDNNGYMVARQTPTERFEMPTLLNLAVAYDVYLDGKHLANENDLPQHRLTPMLGFTSNSFNNDYIHFGLEYAWRELIMLRGGYRYEKNISDAALSTTFYKGVSAGVSVMTKPRGSNGSRLGFDYTFRPTSRPDNGVHNFTVRLVLPSKKKLAAASDANGGAGAVQTP